MKDAGFFLTNGNNWNIFWGFYPFEDIKILNKFQKFNHFPGCWNIGRKDNLYRNLHQFKKKFPDDFNYFPKTYILESDWESFQSQKINADKKKLWIVKPCGSSCGRGIRIINKKTKIQKKDFLVCDYIDNPHLINNLKYDLRLKKNFNSLIIFFISF